MRYDEIDTVEDDDMFAVDTLAEDVETEDDDLSWAADILSDLDDNDRWS